MRMPTGYEKIVNYHGVLSLSVGFTIRPDGVQNCVEKCWRMDIIIPDFPRVKMERNDYYGELSHGFRAGNMLIFDLRWNYYVD